MKVEYNGVAITLKPGTVRTRLRHSLILGKLDVKADMPDDEWLGISQYAQFLSRTEFDGDLGFPVPHNGDNNEAYQQGLTAFLDSPEAFYSAVIEPLLLMDADGNEEALTPDVPKNA